VIVVIFENMYFTRTGIVATLQYEYATTLQRICRVKKKLKIGQCRRYEQMFAAYFFGGHPVENQSITHVIIFLLTFPGICLPSIIIDCW